uniref:BY PROTMAP: gi/472585588/gb/EMS23139.1/ serine/threonine protein kinase [Rhodosporidium toruloides NP11] gi/647400728/emb/CDR46445.1/ RHTO0S12e04522g1_1 [Rhodosporidium toruloides] n=1 Tax=Rhodotorula toruloides TaxID=5286 RepID=A0A0K3CPP3_RHOTO
MATASTLMPLLAQSFIDSTPSSSPKTPRRQVVDYGAGASPSPRTKERAKRIAGEEGAGRESIFSWSDQTLAERFQIGYGNWGSVWKVQPKLAGPDAPAQSVKLVHRSKNPTSSARVRALWTEFKCIRALRTDPHPNLIHFHSFIISPSYAICLMDFHPRLMPVALPESRAKPYFVQLLSAVQHLHSHGIAHNDIKPSNILLSAENRPVLIDFGFAQQYEEGKPDRFLSSLSWGTPEYLSPERAKGALHDERLSDVFALGVTMYEIVVGRTPFEKSEDENFLNREQLEVYYNRTLTGQFYGDYIISTEFEALIHHMVEPSIELRMPSCGAALKHRFFDLPPSPFANIRNSVLYTTPTKPTFAKSLVQTPSSSAKKANRSDDDKVVAAPTPPRTATGVSPFSPRQEPLANRTNVQSVPTTQTPQKAPVKPANAVKSPPPRSRIPVRTPKPDVTSPLVKSATPIPSRIPTSSGRPATLGHKRIVSSPTMLRTRPRVVSQPLLSKLALEEPSPVEKADLTTNSGLTRSSSVKSVKRKPVPAMTELDFVPTLPKTIKPARNPETISHAREDSGFGLSSTEEDEEVLASNPASPVPQLEADSSSDSSPSAPTTPTDELPTFVSTSRTYIVKRKSKAIGSEGTLTNLGGVLTNELPRLSRKSSQAVAARIGKLSVKNVRRAPSAMSFAGLKAAVTGRRRASLTDSMFEMVEAERLDERNAHTMPLRLEHKVASPRKERARLASFSRQVQHVLDSRNVVDPFMNSPTASLGTTTPVRVALPAADEPLKPFSFNGTASLNSKPVEFENLAISPPQRSSSLRRNSPGKQEVPTVSPPTSPEASTGEFKPGHRRIPTAIRNLPSVVLHESADDGDYSESDYSRADTPAFERVASPPPPPRIVEEARQLPTCKSCHGEADVDEPTVTLGSPTRIRRVPSKLKKGSVIATYETVSTPSPARSTATRPPLTRGGTYESVSPAAGTHPRPASPSHTALPFTNLHLRSDSRSTFNSISSTHSNNRKPGGKGLHKRSRSVLSFFSLSSAGGGDGRDTVRSASRMSNVSNLGWSTSSRDVLGQSQQQQEREGQMSPPPVPSGKKAKKGGRLRKAMSKVFR